eukprot:UN12198
MKLIFYLFQLAKIK